MSRTPVRDIMRERIIQQEVDMTATEQRGRFSQRIIDKLAQEPDPQDIESRDVWFTNKPEKAYYLSGNTVLNTLIELFGADGWSFEAHESFDYEAAQRLKGAEVFKQRVCVVRGTLKIFQDGLLVVSRSGIGTNTISSESPGDIDKGIKGAETNALRRAAKTLGPVFGLNLNDEDTTSAHQGRSGRAASNRGNRQADQGQQRGARPAQETPARPQATSAPVAANGGQPAGNDGNHSHQHVGDLMKTANDIYGIASPDGVLARAQRVIPEAKEFTKVSELLPFINDERLIAELAKAD